jgi:ATP-citrate lyase alpha-subunit
MLDFDYMCGNEPSVVAIFSQKKMLYKLFRGSDEIIIPSITSRDECAKYTPNVLINLASSRSATQVVREALALNLFQYIVVIAEGIPERETRSLISYAKGFSCTLIGPSTVGGIIAGKFRIANTGGSIENMIKSKLFSS